LLSVFFPLGRIQDGSIGIVRRELFGLSRVD